MIVVLMVAAGATWESAALGILDAHPGTVVLKRCVDLDDLLAAASNGRAEAAVLAIDTRGLDAAAVARLRGHGVRPVGVVPADRAEPAQVAAARIGVSVLVGDDELTRLPDELARPDVAPGPPPRAALDRPAGPPVTAGLLPSELPTQSGPSFSGRVLAVWGPTGGPGRTTVAAGLAAELARRRRRTVLIDVDPYGGALAQHLGIMDEVSGLLAAARLSTSGSLEARWSTVPRAVAAELAVVTGLPRADRWVEVRAGVVEHLLEVARGHGDVVVDTGFCLEDDPAADIGGRPGRNQLTLEALECADEVVVVGSADPVGLSRLARGLAELREARPGIAVRVVVNRMRASLGWSEKEVAAMVGDFVRPVGLHFLPEDRAAVDRSAVSGRALVETGDSPLRRAIAAMVDTMVPAGEVRTRRAGRARRR